MKLFSPYLRLKICHTLSISEILKENALIIQLKEEKYTYDSVLAAFMTAVLYLLSCANGRDLNAMVRAISEMASISSVEKSHTPPVVSVTPRLPSTSTESVSENGINTSVNAPSLVPTQFHTAIPSSDNSLSNSPSEFVQDDNADTSNDKEQPPVPANEPAHPAHATIGVCSEEGSGSTSLSSVSFSDVEQYALYIGIFLFGNDPIRLANLTGRTIDEVSCPRFLSPLSINVREVFPF